MSVREFVFGDLFPTMHIYTPLTENDPLCSVKAQYIFRKSLKHLIPFYRHYMHIAHELVKGLRVNDCQSAAKATKLSELSADSSLSFNTTYYGA